ncbi:Aste57867_18725 [Aphanomyces stellatus]|uniref:Aste57867_18725 protein n=1 Tax=Aphanomyces stellatus TaxID=120398 RepID=A0A485LEV2_9STRA|nr:hypothetical protein As57867_018661 [Aphanomyces stellatus]VFT95459.1 Aste57867_18725 [Aphanomyces stellatus]
MEHLDWLKFKSRTPASVLGHKRFAMFYRPGAQTAVTRAVQRALNRGSKNATSSAFRRMRNKNVVLESVVRPVIVAGVPMLINCASYMTDIKTMFTCFEEDDDGTYVCMCPVLVVDVSIAKI